MEKVLNIGAVGFGGRGIFLLENAILPNAGVRVAAVCDSYPDRLAAAGDLVEKAAGHRPRETADYADMLAMPDIDALVIMSSWETHIPMACQAMEAGKTVGVEVAGAYALEDCWRLVETHRRTGVHCMLLENCCYGRDELMLLAMAQQGLFGDIVHCAGGYHHDLRDEVAFGVENRHYRFRNYLRRNCENYPTHELGPLAFILGLGRGNRMLSLVSVASRAAGLRDYVLREKGAQHPAARLDFRQGDVVTTVITCAGGESITLTLDTTLPRPYSRGLVVQGTRGCYTEENKSLFLDGVHDPHDLDWRKNWGNAEGYRAEYEHPIWQRYLAEGVRAGHDGMDWLVFSDFFHAARHGLPPPIDVYDMAAWMSVSCLSEESIAKGGAPVAVPDFTGGSWMEQRAPALGAAWGL